MDDFLTWYRQKETELHPLALAALAHQKFVFIHPFVDGNGRVARLLMNLVLLRFGYPVTIIPPILRLEYIAAIPTPVILYGSSSPAKRKPSGNCCGFLATFQRSRRPPL